MTAMPVMIFVLCVMAIAYRFYSAFLAAKVAMLDDTRTTPAYALRDDQNYHPTNKWVVFGHHFAAISGAGPLIGPVLAAQFGYLPGLLWIVIGVCLGGAVQDFLILAASLRRGGRSLAQIAYSDIGKVAGTASVVAILFILIIALAGLGKVVVKALGGEVVAFPPGSSIMFPPDQQLTPDGKLARVPAGATLKWNNGNSLTTYQEAFDLAFPSDGNVKIIRRLPVQLTDNQPVPIRSNSPFQDELQLPPGTVRNVAGSSWGLFTIACTIPIALLVGLWMYKIRPGHVIEASTIGAILTLAATVGGGFIAGSSLESVFNLSQNGVIVAMAIYGFVASVLPIWFLLTPRDYLSSFLKIGTILILVGGVLIANPKFQAPAINHVFLHGGPTVPGNIFPFLFITIMCGAISGFHSLVSSGTTPKMVKKESDARMIGYGAMLIEGLVGVCAMIAATTLSPGDYYAMNTDLAKAPMFHDKFVQIGADIDHLNIFDQRTQESLRGRTGGAVTLAVGMASIFDGIPRKFGIAAEGTLEAMWKYWYHFAIMFEALFILTTIDAGTRIGRFLLQEVFGKVFGEKYGRVDWWPGAILASAIIVGGWSFFIVNNSMAAIWPMFGVANQMLAVIALAVASVYLVNTGKAIYLWVTLIPMAFVFTTTTTGAVEQFQIYFEAVRMQLAKTSGMNWTILINSAVTAALLALMEICAVIVLICAVIRVLGKDIAVERRGAAGVAA